MAEVKKIKDKVFRKYLFFSARPATGGIISLICGGAAIAMLIVCVCLSYGHGGHAGKVVGSLAFTSFIVSALGIASGFIGLKEDGRAYLPCKIGIIMDGCLCAFVTALFVIGV